MQNLCAIFAMLVLGQEEVMGYKEHCGRFFRSSVRMYSPISTTYD